MWKIEKIVKKGDYNYAVVKDHPNATKNGYVLHHRIVMENHLGRILNSNEVVHHKDGNKKNNKISNLEVMDRIEHLKHHGAEQLRQLAEFKCPWCRKVFARRKGQSLDKPSKCTFCSRSCNGKFQKYVQLHGLTREMKNAISGNLIRTYKVDNENREVTEDNQEP